MFPSLAEFKKERALKKERAFPCTPFRKKKVLNSKRESTRSSLSRDPLTRPGPPGESAGGGPPSIAAATEGCH